MKCDRCNGNGKYKTIFGNTIICDFCYGTGEIAYGEDNRIEPIGNIKPMTNEEWFCGLSTEEKAKFLRQIYRDGRDDYIGEWYEQTEADFVEWLKQPNTIKE